MPIVLIIHSVHPQELPVSSDLLLDVLVWIYKYYGIVVHAVWEPFFGCFLRFLSCDFVSCHLAWVLLLNCLFLCCFLCCRLPHVFHDLLPGVVYLLAYFLAFEQ